MPWEGSDPLGARELGCLEERGLGGGLGVRRVSICSHALLKSTKYAV